jgi:hypothetical protein
MMIAFVVGAFWGMIVWLARASLARHVSWDEQGVEVTWYRGERRYYVWDDLRRLDADSQEGPTVRVTTSHGDAFAALSGYPGFSELAATLEARIWSRQDDS